MSNFERGKDSLFILDFNARVIKKKYINVYLGRVALSKVECLIVSDVSCDDAKKCHEYNYFEEQMADWNVYVDVRMCAQKIRPLIDSGMPVCKKYRDKITECFRRYVVFLRESQNIYIRKSRDNSI